MSKTILEEGPPNKRLILTLKEYKGHPFLDIRYWYYDENTKELKPSRKGITLNKKNYLQVLKSFNVQNERILDWLGISDIPEEITKYINSQQKSLERSKYQTGKLSSCENSEDMDNCFFNVEHKGGLDKISYNSSHPFIKELLKLTKQTLEGDLFQDIIDALLISYDKARRRYGNGSVLDKSILFEGVEFNWSEYLKRYIEGE